jgi:acetyl-CoA synthetase
VKAHAQRGQSGNSRTIYSFAAPGACPGQRVPTGAYVTTTAGTEDSEKLRRELSQWVRKEIRPIATPDAIQFAPALPKTRSGKIMRRILRKIAENDVGNLGDTSTLADTGVVEDLVKGRPAV